MISKFMSGLLLWLLFALIGLVIIVIILGWSTGIGWVVIKLLPFTLFEATLLVMLSSFVAGYLVFRLINLSNEIESEIDAVDFSPESSLFSDAPIPLVRFVQPDEGETDEAWFRYHVANDIYERLQDDLELDESMGVTRAKELAVRLTDVVTAVFQSRKSRAKRVSVTTAQLKKQMNKMKLRPYDDDILQTTVRAVNTRLAYDDELVDIIRDKTWDDPL